MNDKLMFVLCRTCGENQNSNSCTHSIEERVLKGVWIIDEVLKAVKEGYKILNIWEIWQYETEQYDSLTKTGGLFSEMMNKFIKIKQQASGWPARCVTKEEKEQYIQEFFQREGIALEFDEISKNEGLRSLAKLMLNSLWGKFGQKQNQPKTSIISDSKEFYQILSNPCLTVTHIQEINEDTLVVNWLNKEEAYDPLSTVNVVLASYVTTQARLKLYSYLEQLGERVLYYDTDSVIFISRPGLPDLPTGDFLGDLTDELQEYGSNSYITEFASGGPKNYSYKVRCPLTNDEHVVCKVKGIRINYATSKTINFETIKELILTSDISGNTKPVIISGENIRRTKDFEVVSRKESKMYRINATKRKFLDNYDSVPYGYIPKKIEKFQ